LVPFLGRKGQWGPGPREIYCWPKGHKSKREELKKGGYKNDWFKKTTKGGHGRARSLTKVKTIRSIV